MRDIAHKLAYNGWPNYETWAVNAHLTSDTELLERLMSIVQNCDLLTEKGEALAEWCRIDSNAQPEDISIDGAFVGMYMDLLAAAFDNVDWRAIIIHNRSGWDK